MPAERIHQVLEDEMLEMFPLRTMDANAIYALIMWLEGFQEEHGQVPGAFELLMAYRSGTVRKKKPGEL